jgi:hypothetical protein
MYGVLRNVLHFDIRRYLVTYIAAQYAFRTVKSVPRSWFRHFSFSYEIQGLDFSGALVVSGQTLGLLVDFLAGMVG